MILDKINDILSPEEESIFDAWYSESDAHRAYFDRVQKNYLQDLDAIDMEKAWEAVEAKISPKKRSIKYYVYAAAAGAAVLIGITYFTFTAETIHAPENRTPAQGVVLTLSDGTQVVLSDHKNGVIASQKHAVITQDNEGQIRYEGNNKKTEGKAVYNTLSTPNGETFQITLPDGTRVWMNAGSSLKYPTYFQGSERSVVLTGEAYFEAAHNEAMPFKVLSNGQQVEVMGTHFNVRAYPNEPVFKTTLLEGKIKITQGDNAALVKPGQQIIVSADKHSMKTREVNAELSLAWKNRLFYFENARYDEIMREIERWYDVDVIYKGKIPDQRFEGAIQKDLKLNQVLKMLESRDIHFKISGKEVIVTP